MLPLGAPAAAVETPARLYLIDGSSYVYRAFHAIPFLSTSKGVPTNAVYGFTTMLLKLLREERPSHVAIVFDAPGGTFRDELFADYKANRTAMPDELVPQIPLLHRMVAALALPVLQERGVEADDVIGTLATRVAAAGTDVVIVTGDKDFQQLVSGRISLLDTMYGKRTSLDDVRTRYGLEPERWVDVVGLMGDPIDNIPGIRGIGEKTAAALIRHAGSLETLLATLDGLETSGIRGAKGLAAKIAEHADQTRLAKSLAVIRRDLPLGHALEEFRARPMQRAEVEELCREFEFHSLLRELGNAAVETLAPATDPARSGPAVLAELGSAAQCALALDTSAESAMRAVPRALALAPDGEAGVSIAAPPPVVGERARTDAWPSQVTSALAASSCEKIGVDLKRSTIVLARHGVPFAGPLFDLGIASYVLDPSRASHGVGELARHFLGVAPPSGESGERSDASAPSRGDGDQPDSSRLEWEARTALRLRPVLERALAEHDELGLFRDVEMPLAAVLATMERRGVRVDRELLTMLGNEFRGSLVRLESEIHALAGGEFKINSTLQLREVLFDRLKISTRGIRKGKTGYSTDVDVLTRLAEVHPLPAKILVHRAIAKLLSTYVDPLIALVHPETGRVHTCFNQTVTATGRLSSTDPNLQNIPIRTPEGRRIRAAFVPGPGKQLVAADYSQIELRILAHLTGDPVLVEAFATGEDIHTRTATEVFEVAPALVSAEMRRRAKVINFGIIYGMGPQRLARELGIPFADAQRYIANYFARYAGVARFIEETLAEARRQGYVATLLKRRRYLPELTSREEGVRQFAERTAINTPVQGSAADLIKLAMVRLEERLVREQVPAAMILQVHDELVFEVDAAAAEQAVAVIKQEMEGVMALRVPLQVDVGIGPNWAATDE